MSLVWTQSLRLGDVLRAVHGRAGTGATNHSTVFIPFYLKCPVFRGRMNHLQEHKFSSVGAISLTEPLFCSAFMFPDTALPSPVFFVPHAKLKLLLVDLGPAELLCPDGIAIPKVKPWALIDGSAVPFTLQDLAAGLCSHF